MQLEIEGVGQQKMTLNDWMNAHTIFTHHAPHMNGDKRWTCWDEFRDPGEFLGCHGDHCFGFGSSQKEAVMDFCKNHEIEPPFWW